MATKAGAGGTAYFGYGHVSDEEARRIKNGTGLDVSKAARFINEQYICHAVAGHGEHGEHREGQVPISSDLVSTTSWE